MNPLLQRFGLAWQVKLHAIYDDRLNCLEGRALAIREDTGAHLGIVEGRPRSINNAALLPHVGGEPFAGGTLAGGRVCWVAGRTPDGVCRLAAVWHAPRPRIVIREAPARLVALPGFVRQLLKGRDR